MCTLYRLFHITQVIIKILAAGGRSGGSGGNSIAHKLWKWLIDNFISAHGVQQQQQQPQQQQPAFAVACDPFKIRELKHRTWRHQLSCAQCRTARNVLLNDIMNCIIYATHCANTYTYAHAHPHPHHNSSIQIKPPNSNSCCYGQPQCSLFALTTKATICACAR